MNPCGARRRRRWGSERDKKMFSAKNLNSTFFLHFPRFFILCRFPHPMISRHRFLSTLPPQSVEPHRVLTSDSLNGFSIAFVSQRTMDFDVLEELFSPSFSLSHNIFVRKSFLYSPFQCLKLRAMKMTQFPSDLMCCWAKILLVRGENAGVGNLLEKFVCIENPWIYCWKACTKLWVARDELKVISIFLLTFGFFIRTHRKLFR